MSHRALIADGLWYSLCPSFSLAVLTRYARSPRVGPRSSGQRLARPVCIAATLPRQVHGRTARSELDEQRNTDNPSTREELHPRPTPNTLSRSLSGKEPKSQRYNAFGDMSQTAKRLPTSPTPEHLKEKSVAWLEEKLQSRMANSPTVRGAAELLRALIRDRQVRPAARHYKALILAHSDHERGSVDVVRSLLREMEDNGIPTDSGTLHAVLQVLAVHPDYMLRQEILHTLRDRWLTVSPAGWHFVVAGLIREHQFELAFEQMTLMERKDIPIQNWLHSMLIYNLCDFEEFDEVYRLMRTRFDQGYDMSRQLWSHVLTAASEAVHYNTTHFVWRRMVQLGYLHPTMGTCRKVLETFSCAADVEMTNSVLRYCNDSGFTLQTKDYEKLMKAHLKVGDISSAFGDLCTIHEAGLYIKYGVTSPILTCLVKQKKDPREAWQSLKYLKSQKRTIPVAAVRLVFEFCERVADADPTIADDALAFYKELYTLCDDTTDIRLYNSLLRTCRSTGNRDAGMFIVKEMAALKIWPNPTTFEIIILMCLDAGNYKSAYWYFQDLLKRDQTISLMAQQEILRLTSQSVNEFAMKLHYHPVVQVQVPSDERRAYSHIQRARVGSDLKLSGGSKIRAPLHRRFKSNEEREEISKMTWTRRAEGHWSKGHQATAKRVNEKREAREEAKAETQGLHPRGDVSNSKD